ncbi:MAG TPA: tetratricopeptide repeat protein, partial [Kofleriaceae bacterium]|nr:tetratricopeptide repeat protein [Kofleriaceae bacterium]
TLTPTPTPTPTAKPKTTPTSTPTVKPPKEDKPKEPKESKPTGNKAEQLYKEGTVLYLNNQLGAAKKKFEEAIAASSRYAPAHRALGFCLQKQGDRAGAKRELQRYVELAPSAHDVPSVQKVIDGL